METLHKMAAALLERETLDREDVELLASGRELPPRAAPAAVAVRPQAPPMHERRPAPAPRRTWLKHTSAVAAALASVAWALPATAQQGFARDRRNKNSSRKADTDRDLLWQTVRALRRMDHHKVAEDQHAKHHRSRQPRGNVTTRGPADERF